MKFTPWDDDKKKGSRPPARTERLWFAVRCAPADTLDLQRDLESENRGAWAPRVWVRKRYPRRKARRIVVIPILPSFVFLPAEHLDWYMGVKDREFWNTSLSVMDGKAMLIPDSHLNGLREADSPEPPKGTKPDEETPKEEEVILETYVVGEQVNVLHPLLPDPVLGEVVEVISGVEYAVMLKNNFPGRVVLPHFLLSR